MNESGRRAGDSEARTILVVGTDDWAIDQSSALLEATGSTVVRCHQSGEPPFPCNALIAGRVCPLALRLDAVLTVRSRPVAGPTPGETGVVCALREGVPLVVASLSGHNPFASYTASSVERHDDIPTACEAAVAVGSRISARQKGFAAARAAQSAGE